MAVPCIGSPLRLLVSAVVVAATYTSLALLSDSSLESHNTRRDDVVLNEPLLARTRQFADPPMHVQQQTQRAEESIDACRDKADYLRILLLSEEQKVTRLSRELCESLPTQQQVADMYGPEPVIIGLETCRSYQRILGPNKPKPRVAGLYHTATNALARSFQTNIEYIGTVLTRDGYNVPVSG